MSRSVMHGEVESGQVEGPPSLMMVEFLRRHEVLQVLVVRPDFNLVVGALQEMAPVLQSSHDCQHFLVMDLVVPLHGIETFWNSKQPDATCRPPETVVRGLLRWRSRSCQLQL